MNLFKYIVVNVVETLVRVIPIPCKTGLTSIGNPGRRSPVFLTCNYHLTVRRVKRSLKGLNCYLLVANSRGHNVWCGSAGGRLTNHSVVSVLKVSGIEELVDHKKIVLPQLAAIGVEAGEIEKKTGWRVVWGPVYAKSIRSFVENNFHKTEKMRQVKFPLGQRIEMAVMWAFPFSIIASILVVPFWRDMLLPLNGLVWGLSLGIFVSFPLLISRLPKQEKKRMGFSKYTVVFDFSRIPLILWALFLFGLFLYSALEGSFSWGFIFRWGLASFVLLLLLSADLLGSTPSYKSGLHEDRFLKVILDDKKCKGAGFCEDVCPKNCYKVDRTRQTVTLQRQHLCVQCGACIVQCPFDALYFKTPRGETISPDTVRRFKLNLIGKRLVKVGSKGWEEG